ncbi:hypothetical protein [Rhodoflexus caldus]|uniref:hypothetical protein n=1 Tax=Rhodoflexus caldus TaxID=2891236 RepID=UPI00202AA304|nr:hypothetical protein [Rhodoflexus caldus]
MKKLPLLPNRCKIFGWILLVPFLVLAVLKLIFPDEMEWSFMIYRQGDYTFFDSGNWLFDLRYNDFTDEFISLGLLLGLSLVAFARTRTEDEWTTHLRLEAMLWSVILNTIFVALTIIFIYSSPFLTVMMINLFSILMIFIVRFEYLLWKERQQLKEAQS